MKKINNICFLPLRQSSIFFKTLFVILSLSIESEFKLSALCMNSSLLSFDKPHSICRFSVVISFVWYFILNMFGYFLFGGRYIELNEFLLVILFVTFSLVCAWYWFEFSLCMYIFSIIFCLSETQSSMKFEKI